MLAASLLALLAAVAMSAPAPEARRGTRTLVDRSYQSGTVTCYWQCQASTNDVDYGNVALSSVTVNSDGSTSCIYTSDADCTYNSETGAFVSTHYVTDCASPALGPVCGEQPAGGFRKRTTRVLGKTRDIEVIASRQAKVGRARRPVAAESIDPIAHLF